MTKQDYPKNDFVNILIISFVFISVIVCVVNEIVKLIFNLFKRK